MSKFVDDLPSNTLRDWMMATCGRRLGGGIGRQVFVYDVDPRFVIKIERNGYQNAVEWEVWQTVKGTPYARWFAPVHMVSPYGAVLLMRRTVPAARARYPKRMPIFLGDYKYSNYGLLNGRLVAHDYGSMANFSNGLSKAMRKADWWDAGDGSTFDDSAKP